MASLALINPRKRRPKKKTARKSITVRKTSTVKANPKKRPAFLAKRKTKKYRRNPAVSLKTVGSDVMQAATGAGGALILDLAWNAIPLPANIKTGPLRHVAKGAAAIGLGMLASMVNKKVGAQMAAGALTVVAYNAMRDVAQKVMPNVALGDAETEINGLSAYVNDDEMNAYAPDESMNAYDTEGSLNAYGDDDY